MNKPGILQLKTNVEQQTKRLLSQLQQLEYFKADIDQEQYNSLKQSTLNDLHTFQQSLNNMLKDPNNSILQSQIEKSKRQIYQTVKSKFNKDQIVNKILNEQVKGTRIHIMELDKQHHLKNISTKQFMTKKRNMIIKIQETGAELTKQQAQWLATNQNFSQNMGQINEQTSANNLKIAQSNIQKNM